MNELLPRDLAKPIWSSAVAKDVDCLSIQQHHIPSQTLMKSAGYWVANSTAIECRPGQKITVLAGPGNNGGDGLVAAIYLSAWNFDVTVYDPQYDPEEMSDDRLHYWKQCQKQRVQICSNRQEFLHRCRGSVLIDALLGLGLKGHLRQGSSKVLLESIQKAGPAKTIAVDVPSGLDSDLFEQPAPILPADLTVSFGAAKPVHKVQPIAQYCGQVKIFPIGFSPAAVFESLKQEKTKLWELDKSLVSKLSTFSHLAKNSHKFDRGHVLVIGGSQGKLGAPIMAASAAARAGAGWVSIACPEKPENLPAYLTYENLFESQALNLKRLEAFIDLRKVKSVVIGPGMVSSPFSHGSLSELVAKLSQRGITFIIDAGAIHNITNFISSPWNAEKVLLTPHPGELKKSNLTQNSVGSMDDLHNLNRSCSAFGFSLFYKSASPCSISPELENDYLFSSFSDAKLGKAGTGDVIAGICAGLSLSFFPIWSLGPLSHYILATEWERLEGEFGDSVLPADVANTINLHNIFAPERF